ncbi:hypothetical protein DMB66_43285 [Actinoplanes sp. ATCC 53533]|nr:hypothetical protein DMB66_43285 [Actinoplanes sp. ATCC 53533]
MATMIFMVLLTITLVAIVVATAWVAVKDTADEAPEESSKDSARSPAPGVPETLEGVLAGQLLAGEINAAQYRRAVQRLAERDALRHPLLVPPEE